MQDSKLKFNVVGISDDIRLYESIIEANRRLDSVIGPFEGEARADWSLGRDSMDHAQVFLILSDDFEGRAEARFAPAELENPRQLRTRLLEVWGDLLQDRSHKQLQQLLETDSSEGVANGA